MKPVRQKTLQQVEPGMWEVVFVERPFKEYWLEAYIVYRDMVVPYYWHKLMRKFGFED